MPRLKLCSNNKHVWQTHGDVERCVTCKTFFPCPRTGCGHVDCHEARGEADPEMITRPAIDVTDTTDTTEETTT